MFNLRILVDSIPALCHAAVVTIELTLAAAVLSLVFGTISVMLQLSRVPGGYWISRLYVSIMRGTPLLVQLFVIFFGLPLLGIRGQGFLSAVLAIGLNSGAYTTEILRASVLNIPRGQIEAAHTIGMPGWLIWRRIILPQALVASLPPLTNEFTIILKSTPFASVVAVTELTFEGTIIVARSFSAIEIMVPVAIAYILIALAFTQLSRWLERRFRDLHN